jgi:hypothetical protein
MNIPPLLSLMAGVCCGPSFFFRPNLVILRSVRPIAEQHWGPPASALHSDIFPWTKCHRRVAEPHSKRDRKVGRDCRCSLLTHLTRRHNRLSWLAAWRQTSHLIDSRPTLLPERLRLSHASKRRRTEGLWDFGYSPQITCFLLNSFSVNVTPPCGANGEPFAFHRLNWRQPHH